MKYQNLFLGKTKKTNIRNLTPFELAQRVVKLKSVPFRQYMMQKQM